MHPPWVRSQNKGYWQCDHKSKQVIHSRDVVSNEEESAKKICEEKSDSKLGIDWSIGSSWNMKVKKKFLKKTRA